MEPTTSMVLWNTIRKGISEKMISLVTRLFSAEKQSSGPLTLGNNNKGNVYIFNGPITISLLPVAPTAVRTTPYSTNSGDFEGSK